MFELVHLSGDTYYIESPAKIGIYAPRGEAYLIDSGNDKDAARKISKILAEQNWTLKGIINTHSNADHIGGNSALVKRHNCPVYAPKIESAFNEFPPLESSFLYGGYPPRELRAKFLCAETSNVDFDTAELPVGLKSISLPGHFFNMIGVVTPDDVCFLADCLFGEATISKYHISFVYDVGGFLDTLNMVGELRHAHYVPSHAPVSSDISDLVKLNRDKAHEIIDCILKLCQRPLTFEQLLKQVFDHYQLEMNHAQHVLVGSTIRSYLSHLLDSGKLQRSFENNYMLWHIV